MLYHIQVKNEKQLKKKHYFHESTGDWCKNKNEDSSYLLPQEIGQVYLNMKKSKNYFYATDENIQAYIPRWAVHRFLTKESDPQYFI